jgi:hypothetical protein
MLPLPLPLPLLLVLGSDNDVLARLRRGGVGSRLVSAPSTVASGKRYRGRREMAREARKRCI